MDAIHARNLQCDDRCDMFTEKGTIKRAATLAQYDADIDELDHNLEASALTDIAVPSVWTPDAARDYVREVVHHVLPVVALDVDELFDYPYSDVVSLGSFLRYLSKKSYTAVTAQMLDMFPGEPLERLKNFYGRLLISMRKVKRPF